MQQLNATITADNFIQSWALAVSSVRKAVFNLKASSENCPLLGIKKPSSVHVKRMKVTFHGRVKSKVNSLLTISN